MSLESVLSILMLASIALLLGAFALYRRRGLVKQVWLMAVLALVLAFNVAIWVVPSDGGTAPVRQELK